MPHLHSLVASANTVQKAAEQLCGLCQQPGFHLGGGRYQCSNHNCERGRGTFPREGFISANARDGREDTGE